MGRWMTQHWIPADGSGLPKRARRGGSYQAYVPELLTAELKPTPEIIQTAARVERKLLNLNQSTNVIGLEAIARFLLRSEAISSSKIEGIAPSADKVALAELAQTEAVVGFGRNAELVANNVTMLRKAQVELSTKDSITVADLCSLQESLLDSPKLSGIRTTQNWIGGSNYHPIDAEFVPPPANLVPELMADLCEYTSGAFHGPLIQAALVHAQFETIHPFSDGNGRVGRALIHTVLTRRGIERSPMLPISMILGTWSDRYIEALTSYRNEDPLAWVAFFLEVTEEAAALADRISTDIEELRADWNEAFFTHRAAQGITRAPRSDSAEMLILSQLPEYPVLTIASAAKFFGISLSAAERALSSLAATAILHTKSVSASGTRGYVANDVIELINLAERRLASTRFDTRLSPPRGGVADA